jgi:hypothetical protein
LSVSIEMVFANFLRRKKERTKTKPLAFALFFHTAENKQQKTKQEKWRNADERARARRLASRFRRYTVKEDLGA